MVLKRIVQVVLATALVAVGLVAAPTPAGAVGERLHIRECPLYPSVPQVITCGFGGARAIVTWYNRTAQIEEYSYESGPGFMDVIYEAYAGATKIHTVAKRRDNEDGLYLPRLVLTLGDTNRVGGFDRLKFTICYTNPSKRTCRVVNFNRPW